MGRSRSPSLATQQVLSALLEDPAAELYGLEISGLAKLQSGTIYPILARLEQSGWLSSRWEKIDPSEEGRRPRRYYRLTGLGATEARKILARTDSLLRPARFTELGSAGFGEVPA